MLESLNVLGVLKRGFALVKDAQGHVIASAAAMPAAGSVTLQFHDGERVVAAGAGGGAPARPRATRETQPGLFDESR